MSASYTVLAEKDGFIAELITKDNGEGYVVVSVNNTAMTMSVNDWRSLSRTIALTADAIRGQFRFTES